jgi:hypothetical protein
VRGVTLGLLITDEATAPIRSTDDVDVIADIITYSDYIAFSERLREQHFTEDMSKEPLTCRWYHGKLKLDVLALREEVLGRSLPQRRKHSRCSSTETFLDFYHHS